MTTSELRMVADHMGHNLDIHTHIYKLQTSVIEKSKVARVLIAMENGQTNSNWKGKQLEAIKECGEYLSQTSTRLCISRQIITDKIFQPFRRVNPLNFRI